MIHYSVAVLLLVATLGLTSSQEVYYGYSGYSSFPSANVELTQANETLSLRFKFCQTDGILLYATDQERILYFSIGIYRSRLLIEFNLGDDLREISQSGSNLLTNNWYNLELRHLSQGSEGFMTLLNNQTVTMVTDPFTSVSFEQLNGPLYIGGHPQPQQIQASRLRCTVDVCISQVSTGSDQFLLPLLSNSNDETEQGCPVTQCQVITSMTFGSTSAAVSFPLIQRIASSFKLQFAFQTSISNGLLATIGLQSNTDLLTVYITGGHIGVTFNRNSNGINPGATLTSSQTYNDTLLHHIQVIFSSGQVRLTVDGLDRQLMEVLTHSFSQSTSVRFGYLPSNQTLPSEIPLTVRSQSFQGCLYNMGYSNTGHLTLFDTTNAEPHSDITLDACLPQLTCSQPCQNISETCHISCQCADGFNETQSGVCTEINECDPNPCLNGATCNDLIGDYTCTCTQEFNKGRNCEIANSCIPNPCVNGACIDYEIGYLCNCTAGWAGLNCTMNINDCSPDTCSNGGVCIDLINDFICDCPPGYTGKQCSIDINECDSGPCKNGATCADFINAYQCTCATGYTGPTCNEDINECDSNPCGNGATCNDGIGNFTCNCPPGYMGLTCTSDVNECFSNPCHHGGTCTNRDGGFDCTCVEGFVGDMCQGDVQECLFNPCQNSGICMERNTGGYECLCKAGWIGTNCETSYDECLSGPCLNGAQCTDGHLTYTCTCSIGYTGENCGIDIYECGSNPCLNNATCVDLVADYYCYCASGYYGDRCEIKRDSCDESPCRNDATCIDLTPTGYTCICGTGYTGEQCDINIDNCNPSPCQNNGTCTDLVGDFTCTCPDGFQGKDCSVEINECLSSPCFFGGTCVDQVNGFYCQCPQGLIGARCEVAITNCLSSPCPDSSTCIELDIGGYQCMCPPGYTGIECDSDINECLIEDTCMNNGTCINNDGSYNCTCLIGTLGNNCETNINDCTSVICQNGGTCIDLINDYKCQCRDGFAGDSCEELVDLCITNPCHNGGECSSDVNVYTCRCLGNYTGVNCQFDVDVCASLNPCHNGGLCRQIPAVSFSILDYYTCDCPLGYTGANCSVDINECDPNPCLHFGTCIDGIGNYQCTCIDGLGGEECQNLDIFTIISDQGGYLALPTLGPSLYMHNQSLTISFSFATTLPSGTLLYQGGLITDSYLGDFLSLELVNGRLLLTYENGGGLNSHKSVTVGNNLNNGSFHHVNIIVMSSGAQILIDGGNCGSNNCYGQTTALLSSFSQFSGPLYIGGFGPQSNATQFHLQSPHSLICTIASLRVSHELVHFNSIIGLSSFELGILRYGSSCVGCQLCRDLWVSYVCECPPGLTGPGCEMLSTVHLVESSSLQFSSYGYSFTSFHFGFTVQSSSGSGYIFNINKTTHDSVQHVTGSMNGLHFAIDIIQNNDMLGSFYSTLPLSDGGWYNASVSLRNDSLIATIKGTDMICSIPPYCIITATYPQGFNLSGFDTLTFGDIVSVFNFSSTLQNHLLYTNGINGCLRDLIIDGYLVNFFMVSFQNIQYGCPRDQYCIPDPCDNGGLCVANWDGYSCQCESDFEGRNCSEGTSVTLTGEDSYISLSVNSELIMLGDEGSLILRTRDTNGVIYSAIWSHDHHVIVELVNNMLFLKVGINGESVSLPSFLSITDSLSHTIKWSISSYNTSHTIATLSVNQAPQTTFLSQPYSRPLNVTTVNVFIGGLANIGPFIEDISQSNDYLRGCVQSLYLGKTPVSFYNSTVAITVSQFNVQSGCGLVNLCSTQQPCSFNSTCVDYFDSYFCDCSVGYTGINCDENIDECALDPCENNSTCIDGIGSYTCTCAPGFTGQKCLTKLNPCLSSPCNNGTCIDNNSISFTCTCHAGFTGATCDIEINECESYPCVNNATCADKLNDFTCTCVNGFSGKTCDVNINDCTDDSCENGGTCVDGIDTFTCMCPFGFAGPNCSIDINICELPNYNCFNGGTCIDGYGPEYRCICPYGYTGELCSAIIPPCDLMPCQHGGNCTYNDLGSGSSGNNMLLQLSYTCICPDEYKGMDCEVRDVCFPNPCANSGTCLSETNNTYRCVCPQEYTGEHCETFVNPCDLLSEDYCMNNGTCTNISSFAIVCHCAPGFSGANCENDINECSSNPCVAEGSICRDEINGFTCTCPPGFTGSLCNISIDNCALGPCSEGATCVSQVNGFTCICPSGFTGSLCNDMLPFCYDNPCLNNGSCVDENSFSSGSGALNLLTPNGTCICPPGYTGTYCEVYLPCHSNPCTNGGSCIEQEGSYYCICPPLRTGPNCSIEINPCIDVHCNNNGTCITMMNEPQVYQCLCIPGYTGVTCENNIDDCMNKPCMNNGTCSDGVDSFSCDCTLGYYGDTCQYVDQCYNNSCANDGICLMDDDNYNFTCSCVGNYTGMLCDELIDYCNDSQILVCKNGGTCLNTPSGPVCECHDHFGGLDCSIDTFNNCEPHPCNNGYCMDLLNGHLCFCFPDYTGSNCQSQIDNCINNDCANNGTCVDGVGNYTCNCTVDYTGTYCTVPVDHCEDVTCDNGGTCMSLTGGAFQCACSDYYNGTYCEEFIDPCSFDPCYNGGTCLSTNDTYICECLQDYTGIDCDTLIDCTHTGCDNNGTCQDSLCICSPGFTGSICDININDCLSDPCIHGNCSDGINMFTCTCNPEYTDTLCDVPIHGCVEDPCQNFATCMPDLFSMTNFTCHCTPDYTGTLCDVVFDPCDYTPCQNNGTCASNGGNQYNCTCVHGYMGEQCQHIDYCDISNECMNGATCISNATTMRAECQCPPELTGDLCTIPVNNPCDEFPCNNGTCNLLDLHDNYSCNCSYGYYGNTCQFINECLLYEGICQNNSTCSDREESFICDCVMGFTGATCEIDINECDSDPCFNGATCIESGTLNSTLLNIPLPGEFTCICPQYMYGPTCNISDGPCDHISCDNGGTCLVNNNVPYCVCPHNYTGPYCQDVITPCDIQPCYNNATCINLEDTYQCFCSPGFTGLDCNMTLLEDPCITEPCQNNATCVTNNITFSYECTCTPGYTGASCESYINTCDPNPCLNEGVCVYVNTTIEEVLARNILLIPPGGVTQDLINSYLPPPGQFVCVCVGNYTGDTCDVYGPNVTNTCDDSPCLNDATCLLVNETVECICPPFFSGNVCQTYMAPFTCPCLNNGTCVEEGLAILCMCPDDFTGTFCETEITPCLDVVCLNNGTCVSINDTGYECVCPVQFTGSNCSEYINKCEPSPCLNNGTCVDFFERFVCFCPPFYTGVTCEDYDISCNPNPCINNGTCISNGGSDYTCQCATGYSGTNCTEAHTCLSLPCENGGTCIMHDNNVYTCVCSANYTGQNCSIDILQVCSDSVCENGGTCIPLEEGGYTCMCDVGYTGVYCNATISDPCFFEPCNNDGTCTSSIDSFTCSCLNGVTGDTCDVDINECLPNPCTNDGFCIESGTNLTDLNIPNSHLISLPSFGEFICNCLPGFAGDDCSIPSVCLPNPCSNNATCIAGNNSEAVCVCRPGYTGSLCEVDIDECQNITCSNNGTCVESNTNITELIENQVLNNINIESISTFPPPGQFFCLCPFGFAGQLCNFPDLCLSSPCQNNASCFVNSNTTFTCDCRQGYTGDTCSEDIDECLGSQMSCLNNGICIESSDTHESLIQEGLIPANDNRTIPVVPLGEFSCLCPDNFVGNLCQSPIGCSPNPCARNDTCISNGQDGFICLCSFGYTGQLCETDIDECASDPCNNGGTCYDSNSMSLPFDNFVLPNLGQFACVCSEGYIGSTCQTQRPCFDTPCMNDGTCIEDLVALNFTCSCSPMHTGPLCDITVTLPVCNDSPCQNGGTCLDMTMSPETLAMYNITEGIEFGQYVCICPDDFEGLTCNVSTNPCLSNPCSQNGQCNIIDDENFNCTCDPGFTGNLCEINIDECESDPCLNGGTCNDGDNAFTCTCPFLITGPRCEINVTNFPCPNFNIPVCQNEGICYILGGSQIACYCLVGFESAQCEIDINECNPNRCQYGATCIESGSELPQNVSISLPAPGDFMCLCTEEFTGDLCQTPYNPCILDPCENNGTCIQDGFNFTCNCSTGFEGYNCSINIDDCYESACNNGVCIDDIDDFTCNCNFGYYGQYCENITDYCSPDPCQNGTCIPLIGSYRCDCTPGFIDTNCSTEINECDPMPCLNNGTCNDLIDDFSCQCPLSYTGKNCAIKLILDCNMTQCTNGECIDVEDGIVCNCTDTGYTGELCERDIDECVEGLHECHATGTCINNDGGYTCNCSSGFTGDYCETDINECLESSHDCVNGMCQNIEGGFICICSPEFTGTKCDMDIDECATIQFLCENFGTCTNIYGSYTCSCPPNFTGQRCENDLDECEVGLDLCTDSTCINIYGSYLCICPPGTTGRYCADDFNECEMFSNSSLCNNGTCINTFGSYECQCDVGYLPPDCYNRDTPTTVGIMITTELIAGPVAAVLFIILLILLAVVIVIIIIAVKRRKKRRGSYSPAAVENEQPAVHRNDRERLL